MRLRRRAVQEERTPERASVEEPGRLVLPAERRPPAPVPEPGLRSAAERAAARRRLDSLAEEF